MKTSWIEAAGLANLGSYITLNAEVPIYNKANPNLWKQTGTHTILLALTGIHVVGSTAGHSEMIWATFEHFGNTPNATYGYVSNTNVTKVVNQSTAGTWLFCKTNSNGPFNNLHADFSSAPDIESDAPFTISASDTIRWKAFGGASNQTPNPLDATTAASNTEIISIDNSVLNQLIAGDVRKNYFMTGSTWTINGAAPTGSFNSGNEVGTSKLANRTMETYQQGTNNQFANGTNCFTCHASNTTSVSHIFGPLKPLFP